MISVIWFKKLKGDAIWISPDDICPLDKFSLQDVINNCSFDEDEITLLKEAYHQATQQYLSI